MDVPNDTQVNPVDEATRNSVMDSVITATYTMIQEHTSADDYADRVLLVANSWLNKKIWARCLTVCISREIEEEVNSISMLAQLTTIRDNNARQQKSVVRFMKDIQKRIHAHAGEMETLGLASATLVQRDIEMTMAEIWRLLPNGLERGLSPGGTLTDAQVPPYTLEPVAPPNAT
ncbi:hypothetical protein OPQ81_002205 [Rhizoctonia solani]|nr:hypothetical protein OPQ81_002205 [Rhizoctonia solani]